MKRRTRIRVAIAIAAVLLAVVGSWVARREVERYAANRLIRDLAAIRDFEGVIWAAEAGADVNISVNTFADTLKFGEASSEWSLLHELARHDQARAMEALIEAGAAVNVRDPNDDTPLHTAVWFRHLSIVQLLIRSGADVHAKERNGDTPLHWATEHGDMSIVRVLLEAGAVVDVRGNGEFTPLHIAAGDGHLEIAELLLRTGAGLETKTYTGMTPLKMAVNSGHADMARVLVDAGADANTRDGLHWTPLDLARTDETRKLLRRYGAKTEEDLKQEQGKSSQNKTPKETGGTVP